MWHVASVSSETGVSIQEIWEQGALAVACPLLWLVREAQVQWNKSMALSILSPA